MFSQEDQVIQISVPSVTEIEAPLGGTTTAYNVSITEGDSKYTVTKTFWEFEDLAKKLQKKYQNLAFPSLLNVSPDLNSRCKAADQFMIFVAAHSQTISISTIKQFLGIDSEANYQIKANPAVEIVEETEPIFKTVSQKPKSIIERNEIKQISSPPEEKDDLAHEFEASNKIISQQHGKTSFFDYEDEDDDEDLFKVIKPKPPKQETEQKPKQPASIELFQSEGLKSNREEQNLNESKPKEEIPNENLAANFDESEIDDSILQLEDNLNDLEIFNLTPKTKDEKVKSKPLPPPKPTIAKKPALAPKPGVKPNLTKNMDEVDINSYINAEQEASQQEAKLFD